MSNKLEEMNDVWKKYYLPWIDNHADIEYILDPNAGLIVLDELSVLRQYNEQNNPKENDWTEPKTIISTGPESFFDRIDKMVEKGYTKVIISHLKIIELPNFFSNTKVSGIDIFSMTFKFEKDDE